MSQLSRRQFLVTTSLSLAALGLSACSARAAAPRGAVEVDRSRFPQSVASGDPRPDAVLLWTRLHSADASTPLLLQLSERTDFAELSGQQWLSAEARHDGCVRVRLTGLRPAQTLYYRFLVETVEGWRSSPVGRTRSAPAADSTTPLRFALLSCQDYGGRWYNSLLPLLDQELDFILHVGDFIYETAGDPQFQSDSAERRIVFDDLDGALKLGSAERPYYAARSLDNYRQLHRTVRTDPVLQQLLERAPLVAIWDDHEFADDCWQDVATHHDGRSDERDRARRQHSEQAYCEYMPVDPDLSLPASDPYLPQTALFPALRMYRGLRFGRVFDLSLIDTRSERPDHLVPEDAFPGEVLYTEAELRAQLPTLGIDPEPVLAALLPYIDLDAAEHAPLRPALNGLLSAAYTAEGCSSEEAARRAAAAARGRIALPVLAALLTRWNANLPAAMQVAVPEASAAVGRGLAWASLGKTALFSSVGARYFVLQAPWQALAALRHAQAAQSPLSAAQSDWLLRRLRESDAVWKTVASSISFTPIELDLALPELGAPALLARRFLLNVDHWDGFPQARQQLIEAFEAAGGAVLLSGDIHAAFATQHAERTVEFTTPAVSSTTLADILASEVEKDPNTAAVGRRMVERLDALIVHGDPRVQHARTRVHGVTLIEANMDSLNAQILSLPAEACRNRHYESPQALAPQRSRTGFSVSAAQRQLVVSPQS
ncbi:alkaline phosphatase D family protein [Aquimonas sp.]|jgi:alkaline phosphatase D|uniref:alkaline phosphatase D family protein n=1 Tax=Aquimonas sp. TaxID=1872588 RepID=UPI0037C14E80